MTYTWPPTAEDVQTLGGLPDTLAASDLAALAVVTSASVAYVQVQRPDLNFDADPFDCSPAPNDVVYLGTVAMAVRWFNRLRRSPDGIIDMGDLGTGRVPTVDPDIERQLGIGRWREGAFF